MPLSGQILRFERSSNKDGSGLRTVVFFKGCPLRCKWCSTPESQHFYLEVGFSRALCIKCGKCVQSCPKGLIMSREGMPYMPNSYSCDSCGKCKDICLKNAVKLYGAQMSIADVMAEISKDEIFFHHGGGVTLSGGEVLAQPHFAYEILVQCHELGIDTTVETSCFAKWTTIEPMLRFLNHMYIDVKIMDDKVHRSYVGVSNKLILENIMKIDAMSNTAFTLRVPFIPGVNDNMNNFEQLCEFVMPLKNIRAVEVLPYHRLGVETYKNLGLENPFADCLPPSRNSMERVVRPLNRLRGLPVRIL